MITRAREWKSRGWAAAALLVVAAGWSAALSGQGGKTTLTPAERAERLRAVERMPKIDAHAHVLAMRPEQVQPFIAFLDRQNLRWLDICTGGLAWDRLQAKMAIARQLSRDHPTRVAWASSFNLSNWSSPTWQADALDTISSAFADGAVAVKVWKEIGMTLRDKDGRFVMIDDSRFAPLLAEIARRGRPLVAHLGEPRNCWLPLAEMTTQSDRNYFQNNPQYHAYLHPEIPGYEAQIAARDRVLERHPTLKFVGCHLGSLEYDVDELAKRLDRYPNFAVDLAARLVHLQIQPRDKVRAFLIKYQDRILYATDLEIGEDEGESPVRLDETLVHLEERYRQDQAWLSTDSPVEVPRARGGFSSQGVALPVPVLEKIFRENARRWYGLR